MAIIVCPECKKDVSTFAETCPHCGFPVREAINSDSVKYNLIYQYADEYMTSVFQEVLGISQDDEFHMLLNHPCIIKRGLCFQEADFFKRSLESRGAHITIVRVDECTDEAAILKKYDTEPVRCPKCKSTEFSTGARGFSVWSGFVGAGKTVNRCAKCGYTWKP